MGVSRGSRVALIVLFAVALWLGFLVDDRAEEARRPKQLTQTRDATMVINLGDATASTSAGTDSTAENAGDRCDDNWNFSGTGSPGGTNADDGSHVTYTGVQWDSAQTSEQLNATNFGFSTAGTIDGVQVEIIAWTTAGGGTYTHVNLLTNTTTIVGDNKSDGSTLGTSDPGAVYKQFGASNDNWNAGLTAAQVNSSNFGVLFCWTATANNSQLAIEHVRMKVTYTPPAAGGQNIFWFE